MLSFERRIILAGKFVWQKFADVNLNDDFFSSLKADYPEFCTWFHKKQITGESALVYNDDQGVEAFLYLKEENETINLINCILPKKKRLKIGTLKLSDRIRSKRLGEGALGVALWHWQEIKCEEIYVTVFDKHTELIRLFERFGFKCVGKNMRGECVYLKNRSCLNFDDPYKCFPFISNQFENSSVIPIYDIYHDKLFPYSELAGNYKEMDEITAGNGITKLFIATPFTALQYKIGMPVFIYRIFTGARGKTYKSVITSLCTISKVDIIKNEWKANLTVDEFIKLAGNKTVYSKNELKSIYNSKRNVVAIEMVYNGYFGKGHNVTHHTLHSNGLFEEHPYNIIYDKIQTEKIIKMGDKNVQNIIVD